MSGMVWGVLGALGNARARKETYPGGERHSSLGFLDKNLSRGGARQS